MVENCRQFRVTPSNPQVSVEALDRALGETVSAVIVKHWDKGRNRYQRDGGTYSIDLCPDGAISKRITSRIIRESGFQVVEEYVIQKP